jgi:hypothetical protein
VHDEVDRLAMKLGWCAIVGGIIVLLFDWWWLS